MLSSFKIPDDWYAAFSIDAIPGFGMRFSASPRETDTLHQILLSPQWRETFFSLVDDVGLVVVASTRSPHETYRRVRGRSSKGKLSQGEYFHHDGCSGPEKPRIVEIRCPFQATPRVVPTGVAPFPESVLAMLKILPQELRERSEFDRWQEESLAIEDADLLQGLITRAVRKNMSAEDCRQYFRQVDRECNCYFAPWTMGESRFIANNNPKKTMQHRRAHQVVLEKGTRNGELVKRWPAEEL